MTAMMGYETQGMNLEPRYDTPEAEVRDIVSEFVQRPGVPNGPFIGVVVSDRDGEIANAARWIECQVFDKAFKNGPEEMQAMYGPHEANSSFLLVLHRQTTLRRRLLRQPPTATIPVGVMRVVGGDSAWHMSLDDAPEKIDHSVEDIMQFHKKPNGEGLTGQETAWDAATAAVVKEYRHKMFGGVAVMALLERMFLREAHRQGIEPVFAMLDARARKVLEAIGAPFEPMHGHDAQFQYAGSNKTYAMYGYFPHFGPSIINKRNELRERPFVLDLLRRGPREAMKRRLYARIAGMVALGEEHVDDRILMS